ncbi:Holliday junction branch migration protein RuvA [Mycoplasma sp. NEAQ87857]|uniref:Holliday junction branch migration protein RuvA n=1 Tax=Mycoplasma sp. NEAQ87857 TaxID=2683967 RepID=UPI00131788E4|nr:Holliday junction branch migration protein RuvA [Mycoplasma sp. NEAQ87857]QGZ97840.1 Holliday junction branch migration protein RuvA [Mycoplasma sp. NEAQ87857]
MVLYRIGEIVYKNKNNIILESYSTGYAINIANESRFEVGQKIKLFLFEHQSEYSTQTYGFKEFKERLLFTDLIAIDKIGPRIAMNALDKGWEVIASYIVNEDVQQLSKISFISIKTAKLICVELKDKWTKLTSNMQISKKENLNSFKELSSTLETLGFKKKQIDLALSKIELNNDIDTMIEQSIKIIAESQSNAIRE